LGNFEADPDRWLADQFEADLVLAVRAVLRGFIYLDVRGNTSKANLEPFWASILPFLRSASLAWKLSRSKASSRDGTGQAQAARMAFDSAIVQAAMAAHDVDEVLQHAYDILAAAMHAADLFTTLRPDFNAIRLPLVFAAFPRADSRSNTEENIAAQAIGAVPDAALIDRGMSPESLVDQPLADVPEAPWILPIDVIWRYKQSNLMNMVDRLTDFNFGAAAGVRRSRMVALRQRKPNRCSLLGSAAS